jgi:hypothetical protein
LAARSSRNRARLARTLSRIPNAIWDDDEQRFISDAQVAEVPFTAFTSRRKADHISGRLIVRRVKRLNPKSVPDGQGELFPNYGQHVISANLFTGVEFVEKALIGCSRTTRTAAMKRPGLALRTSPLRCAERSGVTWNRATRHTASH